MIDPISISIMVISGIYTITQTYDLVTNINYNKINVINECIKDAVENTYMTYVKPLKKDNKWTYENHQIALDLACDKFYLYYEPYDSIFDKKINKYRIYRLIQDRLIFIKKSNENTINQ